MTVSVFDLFSIGIGPSSSHTVGPMRAARRFVAELECRHELDLVRGVRVLLCGSLGATGRGHGSDHAVVAGLRGAEPETVDPSLPARWHETALAAGRLDLAGRHRIPFDGSDLVLDGSVRLPGHPNAMVVAAELADGSRRERTYYSVGGGFVTEHGKPEAGDHGSTIAVPYPFASAAELFSRATETGMRTSDLVLANECARAPVSSVTAGLDRIWTVMQDCVATGLHTDGTLPGPMRVRRRAPDLRRRLEMSNAAADPLHQLDWVNAFAMAVNEQNAAGGRVVTAPTNGAAGIVPAVMHYYDRFVPAASPDGIRRFLLTATAIGGLYKDNASISGAEVGCQGEVGSASSMAAGALCELLGGSAGQVENAAEIAMEHNLGLTCDPVGGFVQIPCIERNAVAAVKAINAARIALAGDGTHRVSLDTVIKTMRETGADMQSKYKETSMGGLAVNVVEC
ncbi:L-serine ammonia-lyase [Rhodococcus hoagii]|uniref:L-serine ammonia-lyase n=1 Tax=Rhodococcus hoagii TaxID=43767 RepID=UPI001964F0FF|nr:L-serine ammonia-lyase [Prescottella equi]MBM9838655.1 L-serine ammonia-lyase [Prescottella equi]NKR65246.1 L-serine ammonia-lyase [Prescottella equi]NKR80732.1 L-serine ammonia-lyase [Prescottella equi]NKS99522.1 L-serine ammonia-lyase [Prescottella equi]